MKQFQMKEIHLTNAGSSDAWLNTENDLFEGHFA